MIQKKLFSALNPLVSGRCFYGLIPETNSTYPVIVYQFPTISPNSALEDFTVQIDVYSKNPDDIFALRKAIFTALETAFDYAERESDFSDYEPDTKLHRRVITYQIAYGE